jgi:class 3 adenylate cyclase
LTESKPQDTAERRQVTVMFLDLVGSTALSAQMDPEDLREIISAYQRCVAEAVRHFGGFVAKYMGVSPCDGATVAPQRRCDGATERCNTVSAGAVETGNVSLMNPTASAARCGSSSAVSG